MDTCCSLQKNIKYICNHEYNFFLQKANVIGIALGFKKKEGFRTNTLCIQVFVRNKLPKYMLYNNDLVPIFYKEIPTDVIETKDFMECSLKDKIRPVLGGYAISVTDENRYGSTCCLVSNGISNFLLGPNHVLAGEGQFQSGSPITQPAFFHGGRTPNDTIATLNKFMPLRPIEGQHEPINLTDCALGLLTNPNIVSPKIAFIGKLQGIKKTVKINDPVKKVGSTSELTTGIITNIYATARIRFGSGNSYLFNNLIFTSSMCEPGDSGSILVNKYNYAVGMIIALNQTASVCCYLNTILDQLDVHLVT